MASYGITLIVILLIINFTLWMWGVDIPANTWLNVGAQTIGSGSGSAPLGGQIGGFGSPNLMNQMITTLIWAVIVGGAVGLAPSILFGSQFINWTIPVAMIVAFLVFFITPMGNILGTVSLDPNSCNPIGTTQLFGGQTLDLCIPAPVHILLAIFLGVMVVATFMSFIRGAEW